MTARHRAVDAEQTYSNDYQARRDIDVTRSELVAAHR
jgi:hypothetical protein